MKHKHNYEEIGWTIMEHPLTGKRYIVQLSIDRMGLYLMLGSKAMRSKQLEARQCNGDIRVRAKLKEDIEQ